MATKAAEKKLTDSQRKNIFRLFRKLGADLAAQRAFNTRQIKRPWPQTVGDAQTLMQKTGKKWKVNIGKRDRRALKHRFNKKGIGPGKVLRDSKVGDVIKKHEAGIKNGKQDD